MPRYAFFLLTLLLIFGSVASAYAQAIDFCEISYLRFDYPTTVPASQAFTVTTTVGLFSCDVGPVVARIDLFDFHHNLISSSYSWVNSPVTDVTNTITAPKIGDPNIIYATAYMVLFDGQIVGHYMSWFQLSVIPPTEVTTTNTSVQINSQTVASPTTSMTTSSAASTESAPNLFSTTVSSENVSTLILSSDLPYELVIVFAILFMVALAVVSKRNKR